MKPAATGLPRPSLAHAAARLATGLTLVATFVLCGCASAPTMPVADDLFHDELFGPASAPIDVSAPLALSPRMREYLSAKVSTPHIRTTDRRRMLIDALYRGDLRLEYDAAMTRTAAEAFDARSGNCLALVLMTAAFAKELGLTVTYQAVNGEEGWSRADELYISLGHVNLSLEEPGGVADFNRTRRGPMIVDFLPSEGRNAWDTRVIAERTVIAMYLNNRAVELLTQGRKDDAYWYARAAIEQDPQRVPSYVTLAVIYRGARHPELADATLRRITDRYPDDINALSNRVLALRDLGRTEEADQLTRRLAQLDPHPPFSYFNAGRAALREGRVTEARALFAKEVQRAPYHHEFEYWLAVTYIELNDAPRALVHLQKAMEISTTRHDHDLYAGKLARLRALTGTTSQ